MTTFRLILGPCLLAMTRANTTLNLAAAVPSNIPPENWEWTFARPANVGAGHGRIQSNGRDSVAMELRLQLDSEARPMLEQVFRLISQAAGSLHTRIISPRPNRCQPKAT